MSKVYLSRHASDKLRNVRCPRRARTTAQFACLDTFKTNQSRRRVIAPRKIGTLPKQAQRRPCRVPSTITRRPTHSSRASRAATLRFCSACNGLSRVAVTRFSSALEASCFYAAYAQFSTAYPAKVAAAPPLSSSLRCRTAASIAKNEK